LLQAGHEPHRGHGDAPRAHARSFRMREEPERPRRLLVMMEGLTHAHEDEVREILARIEVTARDDDLTHDLVGAETAAEAGAAARAEDAPHGAAELGGDTERHARALGRRVEPELVVVVARRGEIGVARERRHRDQYAFDAAAARHREHELARAVL